MDVYRYAMERYAALIAYSEALGHQISAYTCGDIEYLMFAVLVALLLAGWRVLWEDGRM
jgi:hypothetical protein